MTPLNLKTIQAFAQGSQSVGNGRGKLVNERGENVIQRNLDDTLGGLQSKLIISTPVILAFGII